MPASPQFLLVLAMLMAQQASVALQSDVLVQEGGEAEAVAVTEQADGPGAPAGGAPVDGGALPAGDADGVPGNQVPVQPVNPFMSFFENPINLLLISAILFLFIVVRPQQRQLKEQQKQLAGLKKNDRVVTNGGIHGTVTQAAEGETVVVIRIDDNSGAKMTVNRDSIAKVVTSESKE